MTGRACVTTDVGSASEVVLDGVTGRVVPPESSAVADALSDLLQDAAVRERMGAAASAHAKAHFSRARLVADTERIYRQLVEGKTT